MGLADAARTINATAYSYISSWALLTAAEQRLFDRLPARSTDLTDLSDDPHLIETWLLTLADADVVQRNGDGWTLTNEMRTLLTGDDSYADYLGGQILQQMTPRLTLGHTGENVLAAVLAEPEARRGYEGWFADADEARAYQSSQFAGSVGPAKAVASALPGPTGPVLDIGGGWGAMARAVAARHDVRVDVVDFDTVTTSAPPADERVRFHVGDALDPATWPVHGERYDGAVLSYLFSSIPGDRHEPLLDALAERGVRWIAVHDFMVGSGRWASAWSLQHAVFVPGHRSRSAVEVGEMLERRGYHSPSAASIVDEMATLCVVTRPS